MPLEKKLVYPKDKTSKLKLSNIVYAVQCSKECLDLYTGETKQPLHRTAQHRRASAAGQDTAAHHMLKDSFDDTTVHILD